MKMAEAIEVGMQLQVEKLEKGIESLLMDVDDLNEQIALKLILIRQAQKQLKEIKE